MCHALGWHVVDIGSGPLVHHFFFRMTPEMVLIFWAYFCLPPLFRSPALGLALGNPSVRARGRRLSRRDFTGPV